MKSINSFVKKLYEIQNKFGSNYYNEKVSLILKISKFEFNDNTNLIEYHNVLLFIISHPENKQLSIIAEKELNRISLFLRKFQNGYNEKYLNSGLPFTQMSTRFSQEMFQWLIKQIGCKLTIDSYDKNGIDLNTFLNLTLPNILKEETTSELSNEALLNSLGLIENNKLAFLLNEFEKLNSLLLVKDHIWNSLKLFVNIKFNKLNYSISYNRFYQKNVYYHTEILKSFDENNIFNSKLSPPKFLDVNQRQDLVKVIKKSMVLTMRETDPSTFMDESTLRFYELERGVSIAIYGMNTNRQLPLQSYIGYTLFKNGIPISYGGAWVFGESALFGINIFEAFRGGESGFIMCQLLRVYIQVFKLKYIEVESYQFGNQNPDGIKSGAFWFYYKFGFKPINSEVEELANKEFVKIKTNLDYRSNNNTLLKLAQCNLALNLGKSIPVKRTDISNKIISLIARKYKGDNTLAVSDSIKEFSNKTKLNFKYCVENINIVEEFALWVKALNITDKNILKLFVKMVKEKPKSPYNYNKLVMKVTNKV